MEKKIFTSERAGTGLRPLTYMEVPAKPWRPPEAAARISPKVAITETAHQPTLRGRRSLPRGALLEGDDARCNLQIVLDLNRGGQLQDGPIRALPRFGKTAHLRIFYTLRDCPSVRLRYAR